MIMNLFLVLSLLLFSISVIKIIIKKCDNNIFFYTIAIIILTLSLLIFFYYFQNLTISLIISLLLMIFTYIFLLDLRNNYKENIIYTIPFLIITIYYFSKIINLFLFLAHQ